MKKHSLLQFLWYNLLQNVEDVARDWILLMAIDVWTRLLEDFATKNLWKQLFSNDIVRMKTTVVSAATTGTGSWWCINCY